MRLMMSMILVGDSEDIIELNIKCSGSEVSKSSLDKLQPPLEQTQTYIHPVKEEFGAPDYISDPGRSYL